MGWLMCYHNRKGALDHRSMSDDIVKWCRSRRKFSTIFVEMLSPRLTFRNDFVCWFGAIIVLISRMIEFILWMFRCWSLTGFHVKGDWINQHFMSNIFDWLIKFSMWFNVNLTYDINSASNIVYLDIKQVEDNHHTSDYSAHCAFETYLAKN